MCFLISFVPATFWLVVGYFVLYSSTKTDGGVKKFAQGLSIWIFVIAALIPMMGLYITIAGLCPIEGLMLTMHGGVSP